MFWAGATGRWWFRGSAAPHGIVLPPAGPTIISIPGAGWDWQLPTALGVALAQPDRRVLCLTGDGEMMMGLGSLSVVGAQAPKNLSILVLDNEHFGETGRQRGLAATTDLCAIALGAGLADTMRVTAMDQVADLCRMLFEKRRDRRRGDGGCCPGRSR